MANRYFDNSQLAEAIRIASGDTKGVSHVNKFGFGGATTNSYTVWDGDSDYAYPSTATTATVTTSLADSGFQVLVEGLDANYVSITETITGTSSGATGTEEFLRVFRASLTNQVGDSDNNSDITIRVDNKDAAIITAGEGQTLMAVYTVPANKTAYMKHLHSAPTKKDNDTIITLRARPFGGAFNTKGKFASTGDPVHYDYHVPIKFEEKTDIEIKAENQAASGYISALFDLILLDN
jgi:hypothetical protein